MPNRPIVFCINEVCHFGWTQRRKNIVDTEILDCIIMNHRGLNSSGGLRVEKNIMPVVNGFVWNVEGRNSFIVVVKRSTSQDHGNLLVV